MGILGIQTYTEEFKSTLIQETFCLQLVLILLLRYRRYDLVDLLTKKICIKFLIYLHRIFLNLTNKNLRN